MKSEFLKIAGVKSEKAFYKKYPTEAAFFKAHPEAKKMVKKAQAGTIMSGMSSYLQGMNNLPNMQNMMQGQMQSPGVNANMFSSASQPSVGPQQSVSGPTFSPGNYNSWDIDNNGVPDTIQKSEGNPLHNYGTQPKAPDGGGLTKGLESLPGLGGELMKGYNNLRAERRAKKEAQKWAKVTNVQARAAESTDVDDLRQYTENARKKANAMMPEMTGEEFFPVYGVGTNVLARNGVRLEGGGEIQNTYAPSTLYDDLEYEPLNDSDQIKAYKQGGKIYVAQNGFSNWMNTMGGGGSGFSGASGSGGAGAASGGGTPWGAIGQVGSGVAGGATGNNAGGQIGGSVGGAIGSIFGPAGQAIGKIGGTLIGGLMDTNPRDMRKAQSKIKNNTNRIIASQFKDSVHSQYGSYMRNGGYMNPEYNPQVITMFGDVNDQDFADFAHKDEFRAGGHLKSYTPPSARAMETYEDGGEVRTSALNGEVRTTWGGGVKTLSHNPYMPGTGETIQFVGNSHDTYDPKSKQTGIGVKYGQGDQDSYTDYAEYGTEQADANVEVEKEPAAELIDPVTGEKNLTVWGNLKIPNQYIDLLGDPKAKGKKFKNYVADLSKTEAKQNKLIEKSTNELNSLDVKNSFDRLKLSALEANIQGGNMKLKSIADKKIKAADLQNAINDTAEEYGLVADDLARGKVKFDKEAMNAQAKYGAAIEKADKGKKLKSVSAMENVPKGQKRNKQTGFFGKVTPEMFEKMKERNAWYDWENFDPKDENDVYDFQGKFNALAKAFGQKGIQYDGDFGEQTASADSSWFKSRERGKDLETPKVKDDGKETENKEDAKFEIVKHKKNPWITAFNEVLPYIRPTDQEGLDPQQLMGEMYAMSSNQLEPVQATPYTPQLRVPYDISLQDQLNEITADQRSAQRMMGYNPAAQANLAAQTYGAKSKVLADQFRMNQAMKDQVYSGNIATLNDAELKNLEIYDKQYVRQEQAKSNTKATAQAALNSIADKYAKNKLENRTLGVYENLYNYRYDKSGRAVNMNPLAQFNVAQKYPQYNDPNYRLVQNADGTYSYKKVSGEAVATKAPSRYTPGINPNSNMSYEDDEYEYEMIPVNNTEVMNEVAPKNKYGGKTKKNYSQSSIVKAFK